MGDRRDISHPPSPAWQNFFDGPQGPAPSPPRPVNVPGGPTRFLDAAVVGGTGWRRGAPRHAADDEQELDAQRPFRVRPRRWIWI